MFNKILIANRGEIACRVIKTAKKMGIATVAVYSEADRDALHVELADESVWIGAAPSRESYLVADRIIAAAKQTGAEAIHPGYGFLSENEAFARRVEEEGLVFIGPKHASIAAMGDKIASKKLAAQARVSTIPGWNEAIDSAEQAVKIARDIGYPVMIKATAGGGGKGLRVAFDDKQTHEGYISCRNEARASFGDDRVFIEKFVEQPRHIEIQVLGDAHGNLVHLHERECSIQRRHQKVIEEAPSPFISDATRKAMGEQAVALARAVGYQSAGTVEFVVGRDQSFYFLEMNTRLQVEHPVTECITGLDLVELMIRVAAGEPLPFTQADIKRDGWAIECRINAEDPLRGFLPSTGRLVRFQPPATSMQAAQPMPSGGGVRVDTGFEEGGEIPMHYDSMIAKLVVHGRDRIDAIRRMREALNAFVIRGIHANVDFQSALLAHPEFVAGRFDTGFIAKHFPEGFRAGDVTHGDPDFLVALAAAVHRRYLARAASLGGQMPGHGLRIDDDHVVLVRGPKGQDVHRPVHVEANGALTVTLDGRRYVFDGDWKFGTIRIEGSCNDEPFVAQVERRGLELRIGHHGLSLDALVLTPRAAELHQLMPYKPPPDTSKLLLAPMPGLLANVLVKPGQTVLAGEKLAVVEAMKMENILTAMQDATVAEVLAATGESLAVDQPILRFA
ncbi:MAG TPA: acetyl/propionyl/methylcrotonyl-CoA carboxylase subunit alpha [Methylibium sp.]|uniref:acetyl/propionyl/methylcrotonyl-CoA carboxylase subunit alpha n=1 Tax=Methylibium sp. TaxID=2067992 RepID=UPI002DBD1B77|nr:acetyl/propionyl/methylcrotonyl-CoA carboxylase subunit alpha [Methylibium sp.]HEU4458075.1 acetyl/propionyl/methylcrotonyl-CoA carboxylase subunit alpha [Methylibium sp.]